MYHHGAGRFAVLPLHVRTVPTVRTPKTEMCQIAARYAVPPDHTPSAIISAAHMTRAVERLNDTGGSGVLRVKGFCLPHNAPFLVGSSATTS